MLKIFAFLMAIICIAVALPVFQNDVAKISIEPKADDEEIGGFVLFRYDEETKVFEFLLLEKEKEPGDWSPPKGHVEKGEVAIDAAYREMREETSLLAQHYDVHFGLYEHFEYETNDNVLKIVDLWAARLTDLEHPIILSSESRDYVWANADRTIEIIKKQYKQAYVNFLQKLYIHYGL